MSVKDVKGVGAKTAEQLESNGIKTVKSLAMSSEAVLTDEIGIGQGTSEKILSNAREQLKTHGTGFSKGDAMNEKEKELDKITTGAEKVDKMLGGGIPSSYITEFYGENSSGKSQMMMSLAVNTQLDRDKGGVEKGVIYIDTESSVMTQRIAEIAEEKGEDPEEILSNIFIARTIDSNDLSDKVKEAKNLCSNEDIGLVIIDSISSHYRAEFDGRNELSERQDAVGAVIKDLREIIRAHDIAVAYTNQVYHDPGGNMFGDNTIAWGGNIISHNSTFRVYLQDRQGKGWAAKLMDSPGLPQQEFYFDIGSEGIKPKE